jgi:hypothetical protein
LKILSLSYEPAGTRPASFSVIGTPERGLAISKNRHWTFSKDATLSSYEPIQRRNVDTGAQVVCCSAGGSTG